MIGKGAEEIRPATLAEVARILEKRQGTVGEFGFEQQNTLEYAKRFARLKLSDAEELFAKLSELGVKPETAVKVVDLLPPNKAQLLLVLSKDKPELADKKVSEIEELVAAYSKKAKKIEAKQPDAEPAKAEAPVEEKKE